MEYILVCLIGMLIGGYIAWKTTKSFYRKRNFLNNCLQREMQKKFSSFHNYTKK